MLKLLNILKESLYLPNPDEKEYMLSIQKNEKYSNFLTKSLEKNPLVKEVEVVEYPPNKYNKTPTYIITIHVDISKIKDVSIDFEKLGHEIYYLLGKILNNSLKLRDKIRYELYDEKN
jgi:hypothetical protein